jgi:hypothetical protein
MERSLRVSYWLLGHFINILHFIVTPDNTTMMSGENSEAVLTPTHQKDRSEAAALSTTQ